jgi:signal transduction histidine kinase
MAVLTLAAVQVASSGALKGWTQIAAADLLQFSVMVCMVVGAAINIRPSRGSARGFWVLITLSSLMWAADYAMWVYYEVLRCLPMPTPQPGDMLLLLHLIPTMMALAMLPHLAFKRKDAGSSSLDFALIACWWVYLYFQFVFVWQVLEYNPQAFHQNFNFFYRAELATIILALFYLSQHSEGDWQEIFNHYLVAFLLYAPASAIINILIQQHRYTSGGFWDLPLTISLAYLAWIGFRARSLKLQSRTGTDVEYGVSIPTWVASIAVASIPAIALFSYERFDDGPIVRHFRVALGFSSILVIAALIFTRQQLLNRRLSLLLIDSKRAYRNLERLQGQMMQSEKLASIGKLVAGAAHELNNPLTAILGYSELISTDPTMPATPRGFAEKIGQQARRTKSLVESLLSFARQTPSRKRLTDFNSLVGNACQLRLVSMPPKISLVRDLQPDLPMVMADDNHLLQVFLHLLNNAIDAVGEVGGGEIIVRTQARNGRVILEVCDNGPGIAEPERIFDPFYTTKPVGQGTGLGLSASYGIVQEHEGTIECSNLSPHGAMFCISLQAVAAEPTASPAVARAVAYPGSAPAAND